MKSRTTKRGLGWPPARCVQGRLAIPYGDEEETSDVKPVPAPAAEDSAGFRKPTPKAASRSTISHPPAYRGVVAAWPDEWRERWGRRANVLEETGLSWRDAETQAFVEVWNLLRNQPSAHSSSMPSTSPRDV